MSECVVRMEMPKDCPMCPMSHWNKLDEFTGCKVAPGKLHEMSRSKEYRESSTRPDWCPIICQLPEWHGRLVDADEFIKHLFMAWADEEISNSEWCDIRQRMNEETTIVPVSSRQKGARNEIT